MTNTPFHIKIRVADVILGNKKVEMKSIYSRMLYRGRVWMLIKLPWLLTTLNLGFLVAILVTDTDLLSCASL